MAWEVFDRRNAGNRNRDWRAAEDAAVLSGGRTDAELARDLDRSPAAVRQRRMRLRRRAREASGQGGRRPVSSAVRGRLDWWAEPELTRVPRS